MKIRAYLLSILLFKITSFLILIAGKLAFQGTVRADKSQKKKIYYQTDRLQFREEFIQITLSA